MANAILARWAVLLDTFGLAGALLLIASAVAVMAVFGQAGWWAFRQIRQEIREWRVERLLEADREEHARIVRPLHDAETTLPLRRQRR